MAENKQSQITDKELLAICNLSNLKMEFANIIKDKDEKTGKILSNHTIYSLLEKEVLGQEKRLEVAKGNKEFFKGNNLPHYSPLNLKTGKYLDEEEAKLIKENKGKLGVFYREKTVNSRSNWFYDKTSLRKAAPLIMEYFDRYKESKKNKNHEGAFLEEWEVIYGGDNYKIGVDTIKDWSKKIIEKGASPKSIEEKIPSREDIEKTIGSIEIGQFIIHFIDNKVFNAIMDILGLKNNPQELSNLVIERIKESFIPNKEKIIKEILEKGIEKLNENINIPLEMMINVRLTGKEIAVTICKNEKKQIIAIAFRDNNYLDELNEDLIEGILPKQVFILDCLYNKLKEENKDYEIIFTGCGNAGKLANILGIYFLEESRSFNNERPDNLASLPIFSLKDLTKDLKKLTYYTYIEYSDKIKNETLISFAVCAIGIFLFKEKAVFNSIIFLFGLIKTIIMGNIENTKKEKFILKLEEIGILTKEDIMANISDEILNETKKYNYKGTLIPKISLQTYLHLAALEFLYGYDILSSTENEVTFSFSGQLLYVKLENNNISSIREVISGQDENQERYLNINDELFTVGMVLKSFLITMKKIQDNYKKINNDSNTLLGYYFENNKIQELKSLPIEKAEEKTKENKKEEEAKKQKEKLNLEMLYAPYIIKDKKFTDELDKNYIRSCIRSCFSLEDIKFNTLNIEIKDEEYSIPCCSPSKTKNEDLDNFILEVCEKKGKNILCETHYLNVMERIKKDLELVESSYILEDGKHDIGTLKIGILNNSNEYSKEDLGYIYFEEERLKGRLSVSDVFFYEDNILELVNSTGVCEGAILECTCGTAPKNFMVTSQLIKTTNGKLNGTEKDCKGNINIGPFGGCKNHKKNPCSNYINLGKWNGTSENYELQGNKILLNTSTISCSEGGIITIKNANCKLKQN
ncbi:DUF4280 domain-containing protein [uncultured Fusobacterium sp.]|uniref:DUF4280 domain-containing protein n=1 Tax=uncultured Fusobacterium sp. TaxID=159267 RepID=UPI0025F892A4|nr:DUF4280 domain-containing protein [uncultured Fusobacterium sp.]